MWVDKQCRLVHPGLLVLKADIARHQQQMAQFSLAVAARERAQWQALWRRCCR